MSAHDTLGIGSLRGEFRLTPFGSLFSDDAAEHEAVVFSKALDGLNSASQSSVPSAASQFNGRFGANIGESDPIIPGSSIWASSVTLDFGAQWLGNLRFWNNGDYGDEIEARYALGVRFGDDSDYFGFVAPLSAAEPDAADEATGGTYRFTDSSIDGYFGTSLGGSNLRFTLFADWMFDYWVSKGRPTAAGALVFPMRVIVVDTTLFQITAANAFPDPQFAVPPPEEAFASSVFHSDKDFELEVDLPAGYPVMLEKHILGEWRGIRELEGSRQVQVERGSSEVGRYRLAVSRQALKAAGLSDAGRLTIPYKFSR